MAQIINYQELWDGIKEYAMQAGRVAVRPVLLLYYIMRSEETPWKDKLTIFGALAYYLWIYWIPNGYLLLDG